MGYKKTLIVGREQAISKIKEKLSDFDSMCNIKLAVLLEGILDMCLVHNGHNFIVEDNDTNEDISDL